MSVATDLILAAVSVVEKNKTSILAELATQNSAIEAQIITSVKASVKNIFIASLIVEFLPEAFKSLPTVEDNLFDAIIELLKKQAANLNNPSV
jgi:hypothetical protein